MAPDALRFAVRLSVLVIADHSGMGKMLDDFLTGEGYDVALLAEPSLATKGIRNAAFHLIILDLAMPKIDGLTLVRQIRELNDDIEIIAITTAPPLEAMGASIPHSVPEYVYHPVPEYVYQPVTPFKIQEAIGRIARRRPLRSAVKNHCALSMRTHASTAG
jgi:CheY-like chemotaxis protein